ncbi:hypothetical protein DFR79_13251 [Halanaerobium saccharolyticum]|jgi:DNA-directed RNA polymerase subunit RPC12/RpoP|uniref:Uncharacterized protein n=1 Tax=Halanaerobium saccharolyticum TaxID=43595 RepID=A0A4R6LEX0_9FIRM|nr:hypothetical protein [Halanaerobium saccharolyticum]TDO77719.1 hypothetical protein DFR79_13251 [Halanaerobium saccharolyticum]
MSISNIEIVCMECGKEAPINHEESTENWTVYGTTCEECGGKTGAKFIRGGERDETSNS